MTDLVPILWRDGRVRLLDQTRLPREIVWLDLTTPEQVVEAITTMRIRGAPAIGVAAGYALALAVMRSSARSAEALSAELETTRRMVEASRPTGRNLFWATERIMHVTEQRWPDAAALRAVVIAEAQAIQREDIEACRRIGDFGAELVPASATVLTHCNAGALATGGYGTALGVIRSAVSQGKQVRVIADETRPLLQGARLTAWELSEDGIEVAVIPDSSAASWLRRGEVDLVIVGADRVARNGDFANKIGTYPLALAAHEHGVPFYAAAPLSSFDPHLNTGDDIVIEERSGDEVAWISDTHLLPDGVTVRNLAFDVTPHHLVAAHITEHGVLRPPYLETIGEVFRRR